VALECTASLKAEIARLRAELMLTKAKLAAANALANEHEQGEMTAHGEIKRLRAELAEAEEAKAELARLKAALDRGGRITANVAKESIRADRAEAGASDLSARVGHLEMLLEMAEEARDSAIEQLDELREVIDPLAYDCEMRVGVVRRLAAELARSRELISVFARKGKYHMEQWPGDMEMHAALVNAQEILDKNLRLEPVPEHATFRDEGDVHPSPAGDGEHGCICGDDDCLIDCPMHGLPPHCTCTEDDPGGDPACPRAAAEAELAELRAELERLREGLRTVYESARDELAYHQNRYGSENPRSTPEDSED
jgi:uncharacterized small protein (DUF1192 family)